MRHLWFETALLAEGWAERVRIGVDAGVIRSIEIGSEPLDEDSRHGHAVPGLANVHSHAFQRGMAGLSERRSRPDDDFWSWRALMYRFLDRLTPEDVSVIAAQAYVEMLEGGFTRVGEFHYLHKDADGVPYADPAEMVAAIVEAAGRAGIGLTLLPVFYAHSDFGGAEALPQQRRFLSDIDGFGRLVDASRAKLPQDGMLGIAPHSLRAVTPDELKEILPLAGGGPVHIHAAEQTGEVEACVAWSGRRPVQWLLETMPVNEGWCLIHATHVDDEERAGLARSGAVAGLCPVTEANLGDGIFPARAYLEDDGRIGIGTDSNILIGAADELRALEYSQRLAERRRARLAGGEHVSVGRALFERAGSGGAQALNGHFGLAIGAPADIVSLDPNHPSLAGARCDSILDSWIFAAGQSAVDCVWRRGRRCVESGRHVGRGTIAADYRRTIARLVA